MAAMKPRTGDGPLEVSAEGRGIVVRIPTEGGGRRGFEMGAQEAAELADGRGTRPCPTAVLSVGSPRARSQRLTATASPSPTGRSAEANSSELRR